MPNERGWRYRLRGDPATWLLDVRANPSVYFWFLRDIVGRPEDAPAMLEVRERILLSDPVQAIFSAQDPLGYWGSPEILDAPGHANTLWSLALLAELGLARGSRRAQSACEFILQSNLDQQGRIAGLTEPAFAGLLVHTLLYFKSGDPRVERALQAILPVAAEGNLFALSACAASRHPTCLPAVDQGMERVLAGLQSGTFQKQGVFPPFDLHDLWLALRQLAQFGRLADPRASHSIEMLWDRQDEGARWSFEENLHYPIPVALDTAGSPSRWATLYALRILSRT